MSGSIFTAGESSSGMKTVHHFALLAFPLGTHVTQLYALGSALASAVPEAIFSFVINTENLIPLPPAPSNLRLVPFDGGIENGGSATTVFDRIMAVSPEKIRAMVNLAELNACGVLVAGVITEAFVWIMASVAKEMHRPWIALHTGFSLSLLAYLHTDDLRSRFGFVPEGMPERAEEPIDFIPGLESMRICDLPDGIVSAGYNLMLSDHLCSMGKILPEAAAVVFPTLGGFLERGPNIFTKLNLSFHISPLNLLSPPRVSPDPEDCIGWLRYRPPLSVVYVSFGHVATLPPAELTELARGLEDSHVYFLWSLKEEHRSSLPEGFVERTRRRGKLVKWAPQIFVLDNPAVAVFVTHCGWNSALESISAGVPMLCRPIFADQRMVARAMEEFWGAGRDFRGPITRTSFLLAIEMVMVAVEGERMRQKAQKLRQRTIDAMLPGGSLSRSFNSLANLFRN